MKCKVCGKRFKLQADKRYDVIKKPCGVAELLSGKGTTFYECFDCSKCGCQNIVNIRERTIVDGESEDGE